MPYTPVLEQPLNLVELESVGSTNDHARTLAKNGYPSGVVVWAHEQTTGRGRQGNSWVSLPGNLFMSMILRPRIVLVQMGQLSLVAGVALANVLKRTMPASAEAKLKWPNDLIISGKKAGGILVETEGVGMLNAPWAIIGVGVNIVDAPEGATSLKAARHNIEAGRLLELLAKEMLILVTQWEEEGFEPIRDMWLKHAYKLGETIVVKLPKDTCIGVFAGLDKTGALLLKMPDGTQRAISTGEVFA